MQKQVVAPPSKSISHRALICAAMAKGRSFLKNLLISDDTKRTLKCLETLGASFKYTRDGWEVQGIDPKNSCGKNLSMDVGESGTTCRLITPIVAGFKDIDVRIYGRGRMHKRPIGDLADALIKMGAEFIWEQKEGYPPFILKTKGLSGGNITISLEKSSQYLSGLLLASPMADSSVEIKVGGEKAVSWPYVGLTLETMEHFGVKVRVYVEEGGKWQEKKLREIKNISPGKIKFNIVPTPYSPSEFFIEGDWSNSSYLIAAGIFLDHGIKISGLKKDSLQGDRRIIDILTEMGAKIFWEGDILIAEPSDLKGISIDMGDCPDLVPTVAVVASMASGKTSIRGVAHLRIKESDRLEGVAKEVAKAGAKVEIFEDGLTIEPGKLPVGEEILFSTYADHRMAMSLSLYELANIKIVLDNKDCVAKSFPDFFQVWKKITERG